MDTLEQLYNQYDLYRQNAQVGDADFTTDLLKYGITEDYFYKVNDAVELIVKFYNAKLANTTISNAVAYKLGHNRTNNVKFCLLIDVMRCYDGLNHPTTFTTPEGIALMLLLDKTIGNAEIIDYEQLRSVRSATLSLIDLVPYFFECSEQLSPTNALFLPTIFEKKASELEALYRRLIYHLCKTIAEVDGIMTVAEQDWLNEIALLNDDDPNNDIDLRFL